MKEILLDKTTLEETNAAAKKSVLNEYKEQFMCLNKFIGVPRAMNDYLLELLWDRGKIVAFNAPATDITLYGDIAPTTFSYIRQPVTGTPVLPMLTEETTWNVLNQKLIVGENCVIGYYNHIHESVSAQVEYYIDLIAKVDATIRVQLIQLKLPWIIPYLNKNKNIVTEIRNAMEKGESIIGAPMNAESLKDFNSVQLKTEYIIDKLLPAREVYENKIKTLLGVDNMNVEKKERLVSGEVEANNEEIDGYYDSHTESIKEFCKECNKLLKSGIDFNPDPVEPPTEDKDESDDTKDKEDDNNDDRNESDQ